MKIESVYDMQFQTTSKLLYDLLAEREPHQSISHKKMPTYAEHSNFILGHPYPEWYLIQFGGNWIGAVYITKNNELGIHLFKKYQGQGHAEAALKRIIAKRGAGKTLLANINPANDRSIKLFEGLGFKHVQNTYKL